MKTTIALIGAGALALTVTSAAEARPNSARAGGYGSVIDTLRANGFVSWREIERDDGKWEVEDARHRSGRVYDLDIRGGRIVKWDRERD